MRSGGEAKADAVGEGRRLLRWLVGVCVSVGLL